MSEQAERRLTLRDESDVVVARRHVRELGAQQGLTTVAIEALATAVTEIARNVLVHAGAGDFRVRAARTTHDGVAHDAVVAVISDLGPGIPNVGAAMQDGFTTGSGLGMGLPGARRLVDVFALRSAVGQGTTIELEKWAPRPASHL